MAYFLTAKKVEVIPPLFNELYCAKSIGQQYYTKGNYEEAEKYFQKVLKLPDGDTASMRLLLSKCQQHTFQPDQVVQNHLKAKSIMPNALPVLENTAKLLIEEAEFGKSLRKYHEGAKRLNSPNVFALGKLTAANFLERTVVISQCKYRCSCLGDAILSLARQDSDVRKVIRTGREYSIDGRVHRKRELFYLGHLAQEKKIYQHLISSFRPSRPFRKTDMRFIDDMRHSVDATDQTLFSLYMKKPMFLHRCDTVEYRGSRLANKIHQSKTIKKTQRNQIVKYMGVIDKLIRDGKIIEARAKTELMIDYKHKVSYKPKKRFHEIFQRFGAIQYLKFQDLDGWTEEENHQRKLVLIGAMEPTSKLRESLFGPDYPNPKTTKANLCGRVKKSKCSMEKMILYFEIAKCQLQMGVRYDERNVKKIQFYATECFKLASKKNCHTFIVNATIVMGSIEFPIGFERKTRQAYDVALKYAQTVAEPGVITFIEKMVSMISEVEPLVITPNEQMERQILMYVPTTMVHKTELLLERIKVNASKVKKKKSTSAESIDSTSSQDSERSNLSL